MRPHGTRAKYVIEKCRCAECRAANLRYAQQRSQKQAAQAAQFVSEIAPAAQIWTTPSGEKKVRHYKRACPGIYGKPCKTHSHLRKDSTGGVCSNCREKLKTFVTVLANKAREHILFLSQNGVGEEAVHRASGVATAILRDVRQGKQLSVLPETEKRILAVTFAAALPHALVPAKEVWKQVRDLQQKGSMTKGEIAKTLGNKVPALQLKKTRVLVKSARKVERLHKELLLALDMAKGIDEICADCGLSHAPASRFRLIVRMLPCTYNDIRVMYPCIYGTEERDAKSRKLSRDLLCVADLRGGVGGIWCIKGKVHGRDDGCGEDGTERGALRVREGPGADAGCSARDGRVG